MQSDAQPLSQKWVNSIKKSPNQSKNKTPNRNLWDLGLFSLLSDWKRLFSSDCFRQDFISGLVVACAAVPLSLAIALASGVTPATGLTTAIVAGIVCALFGGSPLSVSGPAAAMSILVNTAVIKYGLSGLFLLTLVCGALQIFSGVFRLGKIIRFVPAPVIMGFTAGIGAIIFTGQLPKALGLPAADPSHVCDVITHSMEIFRQTNPMELFLSLLTIGLMFTFPKFSSKVPAALVAVVVPSTLAIFLKIQVEVIGTIPTSLLLPTVPTLPKHVDEGFFLMAITIYALASLETLLSSSAVDKMSRGKAHNPDQELIGQGLGNIASAMLGGIPITAVIARSALNVQAGAKTRRSSIIHSLFIVAAILLLSPVVSRIPISVLAGILLSTALRMLNPKELVELWKTSKTDAVVYAVTFVVIVLVGLLAGVQAGIAAALIIAAIRLSQVRINVDVHEGMSPTRLSLSGPLTFLSSGQMSDLQKRLENEPIDGVLLDLSAVSYFDHSGSEQLTNFINYLFRRTSRLAVLHASHELKRKIEFQLEEATKEIFVDTETEAQIKLNDKLPIRRLLQGITSYSRKKQKYELLFEKLAERQSPHTLLITCCDSRIDPTLITSTHPGELFVLRNIGNLVPKYGSTSHVGEQAAIEYSLSVLNVKEVVVCGHSGCGAVHAKLKGVPKTLPGVDKWLTQINDNAFLATDNVDTASKTNVVQQMENLMSYNIVKEKVESGVLRLHGWFYEIKTGDVSTWDKSSGSFGKLFLNRN